jgi:hypothetical protein
VDALNLYRQHIHDDRAIRGLVAKFSSFQTTVMA